MNEIKYVLLLSPSAAAQHLALMQVHRLLLHLV